jgi:hypothetical protein
MERTGIETVNITDETKSQITWSINELAREYDLSDWHLFVYGYPERAALEVTITAPDRVKAQQQFTHIQLTALAVRNFLEAEYERWRSRAVRRQGRADLRKA